MRLPQLRTLQTCVCPTEFAACRMPTPGFARLSWSRFCNGCVQRPFCLPAGGSRLVRARPSLLRWEPHEVPQAPAARGLQSSCTCNTWLPGAGGSCAWDAPAGWEVRWSEPLPAHAAARAAPVDRSPAGPAGRSGARPQAQPRAWVPVSVASARPRLPRAGAAGRRSAGQGRRGRGPGAAAPAEDRPEHPAPRCMLGRQPPPGQFSSDLSLDPGNSGSWCCSVLGACPAFAPHGV